MLSERQLLILKAIIDDYIRSAEPVGSRSVSKRDDMKYSPATIRNEMADLEELGFLEKPHSSAGRIPSQKGYRYYVDHLLSPETLTTSDIFNIKSIFAEKIHEVEQVIEQSAKILSNLTSYTSVVIGPEIFDTHLQHLQIIPLSDDKAVAIIVTDTGHVEKQSVSIPKGVNFSDIEILVNILNERLRGVLMLELREKIFSEVANLLKMHVKNYKDLLFMIERTAQHKTNENVIFSGKTNILSQPEFRDVEKVRQLLELFEKKELINDLFRSESTGIQVKIGQENKLKIFDHCSVITATYSIDGKNLGTIGILGPTRMEYQRVIGVLDYLSKGMTNSFLNLYQKNN